MEGAKTAGLESGADVVKTGKLVKTYTAEARPPGAQPPWKQQQQRQAKQAAQRKKQRQQQQQPNPKVKLRQLKAAHEAGLLDDDTYRVTQRALAAQLAGLSFATSCTVTHTDGSSITPLRTARTPLRTARTARSARSNTQQRAQRAARAARTEIIKKCCKNKSIGEGL